MYSNSKCQLVVCLIKLYGESMKSYLYAILIMFVGQVLFLQTAESKYPYLSSHLPPKSLVLKQCEENDSATWGTKEIAARCQSLENVFLPLIKGMNQDTSKWIYMIHTDEASILLAKRTWIREHMFTKKNMNIIRANVDVIVKHLRVSERRKRKEVDFIQGCILMTAEH